MTFVPRWFPLLYLSRRRLPRWLFEMLDLIPAAILSSILVPMLLVDASAGSLDLMRPEILAAIPTFLFARVTRSLGGTVIFGMALYWLIS